MWYLWKLKPSAQYQNPSQPSHKEWSEVWKRVGFMFIMPHLFLCEKDIFEKKEELL